MPKKSKKFIDKKNSVTFHLVHRSQQDPLIADENAPQFVLLPKGEPPKVDRKKKLEEQQKYGIFYEDDYNYMQHLRSSKPTAEWQQVEKATSAGADCKLKLPSSVFASKVEEDVGLLNKNAPISGPRLDLDPDIVAAMDEDFDYADPDNELEDNFIELANIERPDYDDDDENFSDDEMCSEYDGDEERDEITSLKGDGTEYSFEDEETKTRFTNYSMSSSVMRRNEQLMLLDERFEKMYVGYDENEIGSLDCEEIEGFVPETSDILLKYADEFERDMKKSQLDRDANLKIRLGDDSDSDSTDSNVDVPVQDKQKWDCESILSTYSNLYNHPKLISEPPKSKIKINMKTGMPVNVLNGNKLTISNVNSLNEQNNIRGPKSIDSKSIATTLSVRSKDESPEERRERKRLLKNYRKERRLEKKANSEAFKEETKRQIKISMNNRSNVQGNKIL